jgi:hypothetical protein
MVALDDDVAETGSFQHQEKLFPEVQAVGAVRRRRA